MLIWISSKGRRSKCSLKMASLLDFLLPVGQIRQLLWAAADCHFWIPSTATTLRSGQNRKSPYNKWTEGLDRSSTRLFERPKFTFTACESWLIFDLHEWCHWISLIFTCFIFSKSNYLYQGGHVFTSGGLLLAKIEHFHKYAGRLVCLSVRTIQVTFSKQSPTFFFCK